MEAGLSAQFLMTWEPMGKGFHLVSGVDPESSLLNLDSRFHGKDGIRGIVI